MAQTKTQIRNRALQKIGKLALSQTANSVLADTMDDAYDQVYARLEKRGLVTWLASSVPDEFVEDIVAIVAFERAESIPTERYNRVASDASRAQINISATIAGKWTNPRGVEDF